MTPPEMSPDSQRKWFVYHQQQESGPIDEIELKAKLQKGELDASAYVYTEGMGDWMLVGEVPAFQSSPVTPAAESGDNPAPTAPPRESSQAQLHVEEPRVDPPVASPSEATQQAFRPEAMPTPQRNARPWLGAVLGVLLAGAVGYYWLDQGGKLPFLTAEPEAPAEVAQPPLPAPAPAAPAASAPKPKGFDWGELDALRLSTDSKSAPFRIASTSLAGPRPILVGALSGLLSARSVRVALYPDGSKNLMSVPRVWLFDVPVVDGFFAVGPLSDNGKDLPPGSYHLLVRMGDTYIGEVSFDVGEWPAEAELAKARQALANERSLLAEKERAVLHEKAKELSAALEQLKRAGTYAVQGERKQKEWKTLVQPWHESLYKASEEQRLLLGGPMFYAQAQEQLYAFMLALLAQRENLDLVSKSGAEALKKKKGKGLGQLWSDVQTKQGQLKGLLSSLPPATQEIVLDPEMVKKRLMQND